MLKSERAGWFALIVVLLASFLVAGNSPPLTDVHWDSPIYLYQGKRMADTPLFQSYRENAAAVAAQAGGGWHPEEGYSEPFWRFSRIGHITLVAAVIDTLGPTIDAILALHWIFHLFVTLAVLLALATLVQLLGLTPGALPRAPVIWAGVLSTLLYTLSDIYAYLGSSIVSEVASLLLIGLACFSLALAMRTTSLLMAALSGVLAFGIYFIRVEAIWVYLSFCVSLLLFYWGELAREQIKVMLVSAVVAAAGFVGYSLLFYPITNPLYFLQFATGQDKQTSGVSPLMSLGAAGGLLWVGVVMSLLYARHLRLMRMALLWAVLIGLPALPYLINNLPIQARMFSTLMPPLLMLSVLGWAGLWASRSRWRSLQWPIWVTATLILVAISWQPSYQWLHQQPGLWRLQVVRQALVVPEYEKLSYQVAELNALSERLYSESGPDLIAVDAGVRQESLNLLRFFGPAYPGEASMALVPDPTNTVACANRLDEPHEQGREESIRYCRVGSDADVDVLLRRQSELFRLSETVDPGGSVDGSLLSSGHYALSVISQHP